MKTRVTRLRSGDAERAKAAFAMMAQVFEEPHMELGAEYLDRLLAREDAWILVAESDGEIVGGLTAHTLPMTRGEASEIFIYDIAVRATEQRKGIGRALVRHLLELAREAGIEALFVPADGEDEGANEFYRAIGGVPAAVTFFTFSSADASLP